MANDPRGKLPALLATSPKLEQMRVARSWRRLGTLAAMNLAPVSAAVSRFRKATLYSYRLRSFTAEELENLAERRRIRSRLKNQRKRARRAAAGGRARVSDVIWLKEAQGGKCFYCFKKLGDDYHVDHFIPISRGGRNERGNLRLACPRCNIAKSDLPPEQFLGLLIA